MNKQDRKVIEKWIENLDEIKCGVEEMMENETEKLDNMPEGLQESERGEKMQEGIDQLDYANNSLEEAIGYLREIIDNA